MLVRERFEGKQTPFEGDRLLIIRSLPQGAQATNVVVTLTPVAPPGGVLFEENIVFTGGQGAWGTHKRETASFAEVDFHARRTLLAVTGESLHNAVDGGATLQVDIGGLYVSINQIGTMVIPDDPNPLFTIAAVNGGLLPSLATQKFKLELAGANPRIHGVNVRTVPSNLTLRLGGQPSFWARPGEMAGAESTPDFSTILNAFLLEAEAKDGFYEIPLAVHSDALCRLDVAVEIEFVQRQAALPPGVTDVALAFDHSTLPQGEAGIISVLLPPGGRVLPGQTTARLRGSFANSQVVYGPTGDCPPPGSVSIRADRAQATPLIFAQNLAFSALDLLLTATSRTAELSIDLVEDLDGKPSAQSLLPEQVRLGLDSQIAGRPTWMHLNLPVEVQVNAGTRLWLVVQSLSGEVAWGVVSQSQVNGAAAAGTWTAGERVAGDQANAAPLGILYTDTGGLAWRLESLEGIDGPLVGMTHLRQPAARYRVPLALQVGEGASSRRVDLNRFEPLGRVDFNLDFAEFADAINHAAASAGGVAVPQGEHLLNAEFEVWRRSGDTPQDRATRVPAGSGIARALAASPDSSLLYLVNDSGGELNTYHLAALETTCHQIKSEIDLGSASFRGLGVAPDGRRACVLQDDQLTWVDLQAFRILGQTEQFAGLFGKPLFSPDGGLLYLLSADGILVLNVPVLEAQFAGQRQFDRAMAATIRLEFDGDSAVEAVAHALGPGGNRLFVVVVDRQAAQNAELRIYDIPSARWGVSILLGSGEGRDYSLALNPDGTRLAVVDSSGRRVDWFETRSAQLVGSIAVEAARPLAAVVDPEGRLVWVACQMDGESGQGFLAYFDAGRVLQGFAAARIAIGPAPADLLILPSGERLYVADASGGSGREFRTSSLQLGTWLPEEWTLTAGRVRAVCAEPYRRAAILGDFACRETFSAGNLPRVPAVSAISQVVPVVGGVHYELSFFAISSSAQAVAELIWRGSDCNPRQIDSLPFIAFAGEVSQDMLPFKCALLEFSLRGEISPLGSFLAPHHLVATAPDGAELAEVRFTVPANEAALLDHVSLQASANVLANGDLQQLENGRLVGWNLFPAGATGVALIQEPGAPNAAPGIRFRNNGPQAVLLEQHVAFSAGSPYELSFTGRLDAGAASLVLQWLDAAGRPLEAALSAEIVPQGSNHLARRGTSPSGALAVALRIVTMPGTNLLIQEIVLHEIDLIRVPITFIAQSPGELNVSDLQIVYEIVPVEPPKRLPAGGLCSPTLPGGASGDGGRDCCYCPHCGESGDLCDSHETETPAGQPAVEGTCCHCGAHVRHIGGEAGGDTPRRARQTLGARADVLAGPSVSLASLLHLSQAGFRSFSAPPQSPAGIASAPPEITAVSGVTALLATRLRRAGLGTLAKLAEAPPAEVATALGMQNAAEAKRLARRISRNARRMAARIASPSDGGQS